MPRFDSPHFGAIEYTEQQVVEFPQGLPAFEAEVQFLPYERPETLPVIYLQSLVTPSLCFITLPVDTVSRDYRLTLSAEDRETLGLDETAQPLAPVDLYCLGIVTIPAGPDKPHPTVNLLAPVVIHRQTRRGVQAIQMEGSYSHQHPLPAGEEKCS